MDCVLEYKEVDAAGQRMFLLLIIKLKQQIEFFKAKAFPFMLTRRMWKVFPERRWNMSTDRTEKASDLIILISQSHVDAEIILMKKNLAAVVIINKVVR